MTGLTATTSKTGKEKKAVIKQNQFRSLEVMMILSFKLVLFPGADRCEFEKKQHLFSNFRINISYIYFC